ncbi:PAS domain-containing sensor histidine kinase [Effusibacillus consociatus]|uniref:histidine kinase n=1 Tax=Effusibacillus consociatus TaxID=1117041 RepID=A0ABV9PZ42_9BACL
MKDVNWYTGSLFSLGVFAFVKSLFTWNIDPIWPFILITALVIVLDLFPIILPNGHEFVFGSIGSLLILFEFGFSACMLSFVISYTFIFLKKYRSFRKIKWFRYFTSLGMTFIALSISYALINVTENINLLIRVFLVASAFEIINYFLFIGIRRTVLGIPVSHNLTTTIPTQMILILTYVTALPRLLSINSHDLIKLGNELISTAIFMLIIIFLSRAYSKDITKRKQTETELRKNEAKYRHITENTSDLIWVLDVNGVFRYASPSSKWVLGLEPEELEGKFMIRRVHPENASNLRKVYTEAIRTKRSYQAEFRYRHSGGDWVIIEAHGKPVIGENGDVESIVVVARDVTKRKQTEELLRKSDKLSAVGQLAAGVAHEIRNPLTTIKGFLHLIKSGSCKVEYLDIALSEIERMESIINEFLMLSKPQAKNFKITDPRILIKNVITLLTTQAILKNVQILYEFDSNVPFVMCDENQLKQVFINLIQNAIEAMPDGGNILIHVKKPDTGNILIRVIDQGHGISEDRIHRLGEPFYSTKEKGTGLGLMISYKIVQEHNGTIEVQSKINEGTTVDVLLPSYREEAGGFDAQSQNR